jgi:hypothetical protein
MAPLKYSKPEATSFAIISPFWRENCSVRGKMLHHFDGDGKDLVPTPRFDFVQSRIPRI